MAVFIDILPTRANLFHRHISLSNRCPICNAEAETLKHALFDCNRVHRVWFGSRFAFQVHGQAIYDFQIWIHDRFQEIQHFGFQVDSRLCFTLGDLLEHCNE